MIYHVTVLHIHVVDVMSQLDTWYKAVGPTVASEQMTRHMST
jgi:hypothetical protein